MSLVPFQDSFSGHGLVSFWRHGGEYILGGSRRADALGNWCTPEATGLSSAALRVNERAIIGADGLFSRFRRQQTILHSPSMRFTLCRRVGQFLPDTEMNISFLVCGHEGTITLNKVKIIRPYQNRYHHQPALYYS